MGNVEVVVLRHGQTDWNAQQRWQGRTDVPLNATGRSQAERAGRSLAAMFELPFDAVLSSPQVRALETAETVAGHWPGVQVGTDERLAEFGAGCFEGKTRAEIMQEWPDLLAAFTKGEDVPLGRTGERPSEVRGRVAEVFGEVVRGEVFRGEMSRVLLVAHGGVLMNLANHVAGVPVGASGFVGLANCHWGVFAQREGTMMVKGWGLS